MKRGFWIARAVKIVVIVAVALGVLGFFTMQLWNWLVPALFAGPVVTYWQALGLLVLARLLFGLRGHGRGHFGPWGHRGWQHWRERWERMTPEERAQFQQRFGQRWKGRCGSLDDRPPPADAPQA
ncbi:MAG TPA: hypothetical protein VMH77_06670 [Steroidobacteraceae bacterium]|nr:hypothetical protein [Steroidobacteraceae bacterium]